MRPMNESAVFIRVTSIEDFNCASYLFLPCMRSKRFVLYNSVDSHWQPFRDAVGSPHAPAIRVQQVKVFCTGLKGSWTERSKVALELHFACAAASLA
eukprot:3207896-Pleurochrysis_carterae.AAC.3